MRGRQGWLVLVVAAAVLAPAARAQVTVTKAEAAVTAERAIRAGEMEERSKWPAFRLDRAERGLWALADLVFAQGKRRADGASYTLCVDVGPGGDLRVGRPTGYRCAEVTGEPRSGVAAFRPQGIVLTYQLVEALPGGGRRSQTWSAAAERAVDGVRVRYAGDTYRQDGTVAPAMEGDPKDEDGWAKTLDGMLGAWSKGPERRFFDAW